MTAGELKTIIEKGADYKLEVQIYDGISPRVLADTDSVSMVIKYRDETDTTDRLKYLQNDGTLSDSSAVFSGSVTDGANGYIEVVIPKNTTTNFPTNISADVSPFATEYNYFYTIDVETNGETIRVLRGKLAIRE